MLSRSPSTGRTSSTTGRSHSRSDHHHSRVKVVIPFDSNRCFGDAKSRDVETPRSQPFLSKSRLSSTSSPGTTDVMCDSAAPFLRRSNYSIDLKPHLVKASSPSVITDVLYDPAAPVLHSSSPAKPRRRVSADGVWDERTPTVVDKARQVSVTAESERRMAGLEGRKVSVIAAEPEFLQLNSNAYAYLGAQTFVRSSSAYQSRSNRDLQRTRSMWMETEGLVRVSSSSRQQPRHSPRDSSRDSKPESPLRSPTPLTFHRSASL